MATLGSIYPRFKVSHFPAFMDEGGIAIIIAILGIVLLPILVVVGNGFLFFAIGFLIAVMATFIAFYRLDWGLFFLLALVLMADSYDIPGFRPFTYTLFYLHTLNMALKSASGINPGFGVLTPLEMHVLLVLGVWIIVGAIKRNFRIESVPNRFIGALFLAWLIWSYLFGVSRGGDTLMGLWEIRALPYLVLMLIFVPQVIKTKEQVQSLVWVFIIVITFKAVQAIQRFIVLDFQFLQYRTLTNHEDAVFFVVLFILLLGLYIFKCDTKQRRWLSGLSILILFGFYLANRRATYASFAISLIAFYLLLDSHHRRKLRYALIVFSIVFSVYLVSFWNSYGRLAVVAQAVKSTLFALDRDVVSSEDYSSSLARDQENYNLAVTFRKSPVLGIGFGKQHEWAIYNYGEYALKGYITHNEVLWVLAKSGIIGYFLFFFFLNAVTLFGARTFTKLKDPYLKAVCACCVIAVLNQIVVSHVDMQLTYTRNMMFLGALIGLVPAIEAIDQRLSGVASRPNSV